MIQNEEIVSNLAVELAEAEAKVWEALGRYKFQMFGYWAAIWVHLNRIGGFNKPNPWRELVQMARAAVVKNNETPRRRDRLQELDEAVGL